MSSYTRPYSSQSYAPSAPSLPESLETENTYDSSRPSNYGQQQPSNMAAYGYDLGNSSYGYSGFPPGTNPDVIRSFQMVDRDGSRFIDENELQQALSSGYQRFNIRTIRLLMFLFKNPYDALRIGPKEFAALWSFLGQWRGIFERYDRDRSGKIDLFELRDALFSLGYAIPPSVLKVLISKYDDGSGKKIELNFDSFVECGMILKEKEQSRLLLMPIDSYSLRGNVQMGEMKERIMEALHTKYDSNSKDLYTSWRTFGR